jgi:CubicO group peptidase (beta-lactamase class C family)
MSVTMWGCLLVLVGVALTSVSSESATLSDEYKKTGSKWNSIEYDDDLTSFWEEDLDQEFERILEDNDYDGGTLGVVKNGKLVFAKGYGFLGEHVLKPGTLMPISSLSKILTAVGILQLAEQGFLSLEDEVFGEEGLLSGFKSLEGIPYDTRINDITVDHLLRHAGGWDESRGPIYDPMMNQLYLAKKQDVVDIAKAMNSPGFLTHYELIRFMVSSPLNFQPGVKAKYSNFGYCLLGRIIEQVTEQPYEEYIRKEILTPTGMMHTRIGPRLMEEYSIFASPYLDQKDAKEQMSYINSQYLHTVTSPQLLDSTLGWYSNIYDMSRFTRCLFGLHVECQILRPESVAYLTEQPPPHLKDDKHGDHWRAISVHATMGGAIWQDSDTYDNDVILYHQGAARSPIYRALTSELANSSENVTVIALMSSNRYKRWRNSMETFVESVNEWPETMRDMMLDDISDTVLVMNDTETLVIYDLTEHHLVPYIHALRIAGYYPDWIQAYTWDGISNFVIISKKAKKPEDLFFALEMTSSEKKMHNHVADLEELGYHVTMAQSYMSFSHDRRAQHWALLKYKPGSEQKVIWNLGVNLKSYLVDLQVATGKGYSVVTQSVETHAHDQFVTYVFHKLDDQGSYIAYHDLSLTQLEALVKNNALQEYHLVYLDTYRREKTAHFSAIFRKGKSNKWILQTDIARESLPDQAIIWKNMGYLPQFIVGYEEEDHDTKFVGFWMKP